MVGAIKQVVGAIKQVVGAIKQWWYQISIFNYCKKRKVLPLKKNDPLYDTGSLAVTFATLERDIGV